MNRTLTIIIFLLFSLGVSGQNLTVIDSLENLLEQKLPDSTRIDVLWRLYIKHSKSGKGRLSYLQRSTELAKRVDDKARLFRNYLNFNYHTFWEEQDYRLALTYIDSASLLVDYSLNPSYQANFHLSAGTNLRELGLRDSALIHFKEALDRYEVLGNEGFMKYCLMALGNIARESGYQDLALEYYMSTLELLEGKNSRSSQLSRGNIYGNLALVYKSKKEYDKALKSLRTSLQIHTQLGEKNDMALNYNNLGSYYEKMAKWDSAIYYFQQELKIGKQEGLQRRMLHAKYGLGRAWKQTGKISKSLDYLVDVKENSLKVGLLDLLPGVHESLSSIYSDQGKYELALENWKEYEIWKDSLYTKELNQQLNELKISLDVGKKEKEILKLNQEKEIKELENKRQELINTVLLIGLVIAVLVMGLLYFFYQQRLKYHRELSAKEKELQTTALKQQLGEMEMKALRSQMNPHFVFNCLNSINQLILAGNIQLSTTYLSKFAKLLRQVLENSEKDLIPLEDELNMLGNYIELEKLRFEHKFHFRQEISDQVDLWETLVPPLILQPLVENAIWHGLLQQDTEGEINLGIVEEETFVKCVITDNGVGRDHKNTSSEGPSGKKKSFGLSLTRDRLKHIKNDHGVGDIHISDVQPHGTQVELLIPV
ncbi:MAG: histidine kinase [Bacteroidota bacterium]